MFLRCSRCGGKIDAEAGLCSTCGLRLGDEPAARAGAVEIDVDSSLSEREVFDSSGEGAAAAAGSAASDFDSLQRALELTGVTDARRRMENVFPSLRSGVDVTQAGLSPFEGYLLSLIDGKVSVADIMEVSGLTLYEAASSLSSLSDKGIVEIAEHPPAQAPPRPEPASPAAAERAALGRVSLKKAVGVRPRAVAVETDPDVLLAQADAAVAQADLERARELVRLALVHAPNSERALGMQAALKDPAHAARRATVLHGLAIRAYQTEDFATAARLLEAALDEHEAMAGVHHRLGLALLRAHFDLDKAETHLRRAVSLDPDNERYRRNLERVLRRRSEGTSS